MPETRNPCWKQLHEITCDKVSISKDKIVTMKSDETLESITKKLQENGFWSAPVINEKKECIGTIDLQDLVGFLAACVVPGVDEETANRNLSLRTAQEILTMSPRDAFVPLDPRDNCTLLVTLFSTGIHRCPLIDKEGVVVGLVAQFDVVVELNKELHQGAAKGMGETELSKFGVGMSVPITIEQDQLVTHAVTELDCYQVSALPVVDGNGRLVGNFSVTDLINIWTDKDGAAKLLEMTVTEYLERNSKESLNPITCKQSDSLNTAVSLMIEKKIHRVWIVDENQKPIGVVSMTDLFKIVRDHIDASVGGNATHDIKDNYGSVFKTFQGQAIGVAASGDKVEMLNDSNDKQAVWRVTHLDRTHITLQGANDKYLAVDAKHNVLLLDAVADDAKFELIRSDTGAVALHDAHNGFIEVHGKNIKSHASKTNKPTRRQWLKLCAIFGK